MSDIFKEPKPLGTNLVNDDLPHYHDGLLHTWTVNLRVLMTTLALTGRGADTRFAARVRYVSIVRLERFLAIKARCLCFPVLLGC